VVYGAPLTAGAVQLFSVPVDGGPSLVLNPPLVSGGSVGSGNSTPSAAITSDGTRVVYVADQEVRDRKELYVVPIDASGPAVKLSHALTPGWTVKAFTLDAAGTAVAYITQLSSWPVQQARVHVAPLDGSASPLQLAEHPTGWILADPRFSPDGQWLTYQRRPDVSPNFIGPDLEIVPIDGSRPTLVLSDNASEGKTFNCTFTSQGGRAVFLESFLYNGSWLQFSNLYSSTLDGVGTRIDTGTGFCACPDVTAYQLGLDGFTVFYSSSIGIFQVPADGSSAPQSLAAAGISTKNLTIAADGKRLVYTTSIHLPPPSAHTEFGLHSLSLIDGAVTDLHSSTTIYDDFRSVTISPDSRYVLYRLSPNGSSGNFELYSVAIDGSSAPRRLNGVMPAGGATAAYEIAGGEVVYRADAETNDVYEVFSVRLEPPGRTVQAQAPPPQGGS
jgi:Tol biopolymer transport system component